LHEASGLYVVRGGDTGILEKEFGIESGSWWYAFDDGQAIAYMQQFVERGYAVVRATASDATPLASPETATGDRLSVSVPSPSWPYSLKPQHFTPPEVSNAHVEYEAAEIAATPSVRPETSAGQSLPIVVPSPS
jgi:hypothetical protein